MEIYKTVAFQKFSFEGQKQLHTIFNEYKDKTKNNTSILEIIETNKMIPGLKKSLSEIINIYISKQNLFNKLKTYSICYLEILLEKEECDKHHEKVATLKIKQIKNSNYADSAWYGGEKGEYERYIKIDKELEFEINKILAEKNTTDQLYSDKYKSVMQYRKNIFSEIIELISSYLNVLDNYIPVEKEKEVKEIRPILKSGVYFDMKLVSLIHHEYNNIQFENLTDVDLYALLNLQSTHAKLTIKTGERTRMCYLIYKLYEYLKTDNRTQWRTAILETAGIPEKYYKSKYKDPESEIPSRKSESFAQCTNRIFGSIS